MDGFRNSFLPQKDALAITAFSQMLPGGRLDFNRQRFIQILVQPIVKVVAVHGAA